MKKYFYSHKVTYFLDQNRNVLPVQVGSGEDCCPEWCSGGVWDYGSILGLSWPCYRKNQAGPTAARPTLQTDGTQKWHNTSTQKRHSFHSGAGACVSDQEAGERGGFCGCWGHAELPADRYVEEVSGSHYSWHPWRERERENWLVMCMSESKCEDDCRARERERWSTHQFGELSEFAQILRQWYQLVIAGDQNFERQTAQMSGESGQLVPTAERKREPRESETAGSND